MRFVHRTRPDANQRRVQVAKTVSERNANSYGLWTHHHKLCEAKTGWISSRRTRSRNQGCAFVALSTLLAKELHPTPSRRVCSTCGPSSRLLDATEASFAAATCRRHRGAPTCPPPSHRLHSSRIPRRHTDRRTTGSQLILDHGLGPQQSAKARRGHAHQ